uniref:Glycoside hydrolase family 1 n=1 Tax=Phyllotreta striolata TaxID=444603 RepID=A0A059UAE7_PHYSR|nr:glycoside hydrolase family 1 [Phyllotreta striolata]
MQASLFITSVILFTLTKSEEHINNTPFPKDFLFGTATSAYQVEGAWNVDGKGVNNWDKFIHTNRSRIKGNDTADVTCDSYHKYKENVALLKYLGVQFYRFSISWTRILPNGTQGKINQQGVQYYKNLLKELKRNNITPMVTIFHWDTPQALEEQGGWTNERIVHWYSRYARLCFQLFGDEVKYWMTVNEPKQTCNMGYGNGIFAPGVKSPGEGEYLCVYHVVLAHATAWRIYDKEFRAQQKGKVGIVVDCSWYEPADSWNIQDQLASQLKLHFTYGLYVNPIVYGDFPWAVKSIVKKRSLAQGYNRSRLPEFSQQQKELVKGTYDFLGLNYYTARYIKPDPDTPVDGKGYDFDSETTTFVDPHWEKGASFWLYVVPWGIKKLVTWLSQTYGNPPVIITENGYSEHGTMDDQKRISYIKSHLTNLKEAMNNGVNIKGYTYWSLMDNFEWVEGYPVKFGLYHVDFEGVKRNRTAKSSVEYYKKVISTRCLVDKCK